MLAIHAQYISTVDWKYGLNELITFTLLFYSYELDHHIVSNNIDYLNVQDLLTVKTMLRNFVYFSI